MLEGFLIWAGFTVVALVAFVGGALSARGAFLRRMRAIERANETLLGSLDESTRRLTIAARLIEEINKMLLDKHPEAAATVRPLTSRRVH
jgi:hypothetical protein